MEISPLFAVDAEELLDSGKIEEAIDLCLEGLKVYPGYPAGEAVLARCYKISGNNDKANEILDSAMSKNPFNKALETLKKYDIEIPKKEISAVENKNNEVENDYLNYDDSINLLDNEAELNEDDINGINQEEVKELDLDFEKIDLIPGLENPVAFISLPKFNNSIVLTYDFNQFPSTFSKNHQIELLNKKEDDYSTLATKLENAKIKPSDDEFIEPELEEFKVNEIVTETMANIYFEQGAYNQAILAYKTLKNKHPEKIDFYDEMIEKIQIEKEKELENNENKFKEIK